MEENKLKISPLGIALSVFLGIALFILIVPFFGAWRMVGAGKVGVVTRFGAVQRVANPGLVLKIPVIEGMTIMETRTQKEQVEAAAASKDLQEINQYQLSLYLK